MVASSGVAPRFAYNQGYASSGKNPNLLPHSVPTSLLKPEIVAELPRSRPPQVSVNALDRAGNIRPQGPDQAELKKRIIGRLADPDISLADLEEIEQKLCVKVGESSRAPSRRNNAVDPLSSRFLQADVHATKSKGKGKGPTSKRKALVTFGDSDEDEIDDWCTVSPKDLKVYISLGKEDEVVHFLQIRFTQIQQLATKVIAKAWIKAICPKKQANFPYVDSNPRDDIRPRRPRHEGAPRIPKFWPDTKLCRHKEPDHTKKSERTHLLVHLLRLKWTEKEWVESNGANCEVPNLVKAGCWVQFLKEAFPIGKLDEVQGSNPEKAAQRKEYLRHIYDVAMQEENVRRTNRSGTTTAGGVQYSRGPGWYPLDKGFPRSTAQANRRTGKEQSDTPSSAAPATARSDSQSEICTDTPDSDEQDEVLKPTSPISEFDFAKSGKVERLLPLEPFKTEDAAANPPDWHPVEDPVQKVEFECLSGSATTNGTPSTSVDEMNYYGSVWSDGMRNSHSDRPMYDHYTGAAPQWYGNADYEYAPSQQSSLSGFPHPGGSGVMNGYRQDFAAFEPAVQSPSLQGRFSSQMALSQAQFRPGYEEMQQMSLSVPFPQSTVVTTADGSQALGFGVPGFRYGSAFGDHGTSEKFVSEPQEETNGRWP